MIEPVQINKISEILVQSHHHTAFPSGAFEQCWIPWVGTEIPRIKNIVPLLAQPCRKPPARALVDEKLHTSATPTADRESPATTA